MASTQTALLVTEVGKPIITTRERSIPQPGPGQVQIRVAVIAVNPHDQKARDWGLFIKDRLPAPLTNDVVGFVSALGPNVKAFTIGDRVLSHASGMSNGTDNGSQEYALGEVSFMIRIPDSITDDEAVSLPTCLMAGVVGIFSGLNIPAPWSEDAGTFNYADTTILIVGGGSNCGKFAVQVAKLAAIGKIVVVGGDSNELMASGATVVIDRHGSYRDVLQKVRDSVGDTLIYAFDVVNSADGQLLALSALSNTNKGCLARLLRQKPIDKSAVTGKQAGFDVSDVLGFSVLHRELAARFWERLPAYLAGGQIKPLHKYDVRVGLTAENLNQALDRYRDGQVALQTHIHRVH